MTEKSEKKTEYPALFASSEAGTLAFERGSLDGEIAAALEIVRQIRGDYKQHAAIVEGLRGIEDKLLELRVSKLAEDQARAQLDELMRVPLGEQHLRLEAFRKSNTQAKVRSEEEYLAAVRKMVRNTLSNAALLLLHHPENPVLTKLIDDLKALDLEDYKAGTWPPWPRATSSGSTTRRRRPSWWNGSSPSRASSASPSRR